MQIAQVMAGYSLGEADLLRRAMGKKDKAEMAKQQARFVDGADRNGVKKSQAAEIFELVDKFAGYGFNKSHAAAYAVISYHTAYLKANFREEFLAASMTLDMSNTDKLAMFAAEARKSGIELKPPCINSSEVDFLAEPPPSSSARLRGEGQQRVTSQEATPYSSPLPVKNGEREHRGAIRYSLAACKNIGASAVETIVAERKTKGAFKSIGDFAGRMNPKALNKRGIETLAAAGAFDRLELNRAAVHASADGIMAMANRTADNAASGTSDLFGGGGSQPARLDLKPAQAWTPMERLSEEFKAIGFYLSGHPLDQYGPVLAKMGVKRFVEFEQLAARGASAGRLAGIVIAARERRSQKGNKFAFAIFSDATAQFEAVIFSDTLAKARDLLEPGTAVLLSVEAERDGETLKLRVQSVEALDAAAQAIPRGLRIVLDRRAIQSRKVSLAGVKALLKPAATGIRGCDVEFRLPLDDRGQEMILTLPGRYDVSPSDAGVMSTLPGIAEVMEV